MIDFIYKTVKLSHLEKFRIIQNVPIHLHIFLLNFDKTNHSFLHPFFLFAEADFRKILPGFLIGERRHGENA